MIRAGFVLASPGAGWLGGLSYFRNLFHALRELTPPSLVPVIITTPYADAQQLDSFQPIEVLRTSLVDIRPPWWQIRRATQLYLDRDLLFERFLRRHRIDLLSHSGYLGRKSAIPSLCWIPDFQELHLPGLFSASELAARHRNLQQSCRHASAILLSSQSAHKDLLRVSATCAKRGYVLPFVASVPAVDRLPTRQELEERYAFASPFFHLPNQFWAHKNHAVVIDAVRNLLSEGRPVLVLATGNTEDHRQPAYFRQLQTRIAELQVKDLFRVLGVVPYRDLMALMAHSVAVINPSLFEGWSTTVEEAKSFGKHVIVSDIAVHREQQPQYGSYFPPSDARELADKLWLALEQFDAAVDQQRMRTAWERLPSRRIQFARHFGNIVSQVLQQASAM